MPSLPQGSCLSGALVPFRWTVDFLGGRLTSDGGLPWLAEAEAVPGTDRAPGGGPSGSAAGADKHTMRHLAGPAGAPQIACGYDNENDAETLRHRSVAQAGLWAACH